MTRLEGLIFLLPFLRAEHTCCLTAASLDFAKGAFFEANRGKNHTLYLYLPELLICVKGITEVVFYLALVLRSKKSLKKERRPIANKQLLYQSSLLPHFLPHGATVTKRVTEDPYPSPPYMQLKRLRPSFVLPFVRFCKKKRNRYLCIFFFFK